MVRRIIWVVMVVGAAGLGGCIAVGGTTNQPTRGQELIDLKTALDRGAITQADYDATKAQIVNRR